MMKNLFTFLLITALAAMQTTVGQTSAGKCWSIDYDIWNINQPRLHIDCGNNDVFNVGAEMTLEVWVRAYTFGENRKMMGKIASDGSVFNNGYDLGFQNLNVYAEIWNPALQQIPYPNPGPIRQDSAFVHLATTYSSNTNKLTDYVNGHMVAQVDVFPPNPITANDAHFFIGAAPWDQLSFQFYGDMDEIRVWNVERSEAELSEYMYKELKGVEAGLVAYYNFNMAHDTIVPDLGPYSNTGELRNSDDPSWSWADSYAPVGDERMYDMLEPAAAWCGRTDDEFYAANTENGLSIFTDIKEKEFWKYLVFGYDGLTGTASDFAPNDAPADFVRANRSWYLNNGGNVTSDVFFNLVHAAGGGSEIPSGEEANLYVLLYRSDDNSNFKAIAHPNQIFNENLIFNDRQLNDGYYCVGYASTEIPLEPSAVREEVFKDVTISPIPAHDFVIIQNAAGSRVSLFSINGNEIYKKRMLSDRQAIPTSDFDRGLYFLRLEKEGQLFTQKIIIK